MVQDDVVGHVEALPHAQMVKQGGLPKHIAHVDDRDVWKEEDETKMTPVMPTKVVTKKTQPCQELLKFK